MTPSKNYWPIGNWLVSLNIQAVNNTY